MGSEYILFDDTLRDRFVAFAAAHGISSTMRPDEIAGFVITLPEDLTDEVQDAIDAEYESIMDAQMLLAESDEALVSHHAFGVTVALADGTHRLVRIPSEVARRLLAHFTAEEVHEIATAIVQGADNPVDGPICHKPSA